LNKFGGKLLNYFQFNYPIISYHLYSPIEKYFNLKLRPWQNEYPEIECESIKDGLKDFTLFSHINELVFNFNHFESSHIKDILRICEIFGSKIEALCLREVEDSDTPLIISNLKEKKLKAIVFDSEIPYKNNNVKQAPNQNGLTKDGIAQLITLFQTLPELEEFRFENHQFDDEGVKLISDFIQNHPRLKTITLNTPFSEIAMEELCRSIKTTGIETLIIDGVRMKNYTNDGLLRWAELISENSTLKNLSLNNNQLNDSHLDLIIYIIKHNASLEIIDLLGNEDITSEGRKKLKNALQNNTTIKELMINNSYYNSVNLVKSKKAMDLTTDDA
ncbi:MAG: hypothetical protein Q8K60_05070, partial [Parachlamydiaceae bacterium]|nr:hypothetical protein [Parachlamydiaceae bacterium]